MGIGTNTAEWKTTKRHICRSSSYWLSKLTTERLYYFVVKIYQNQIELQLFPLAVVNGSSLRAEEKEKNSLFLYRLYVRRTTSYGKRVGQMNKLILPFLGSPFRRWVWATSGKKQTRDQKLMSNSQLIAKNFNGINLLVSCCWKIENLRISNWEHRKRLPKKCRLNKTSHDFRKVAGQTNNLVLTFVGKAFHNWNWDKHHAKKNHRATHL